MGKPWETAFSISGDENTSVTVELDGINTLKLFFALDGEWDEIIMGEDAQIIFNAFFAKLEAALAELAA